MKKYHLDDSDSDNLSDTWEIQTFGDLSHVGWMDDDGDGQTNEQEFLAGTDPLDFFNGAAVTLTVVSGDNQTSVMRQFAPNPLAALVTTNGQAVAGATLRFTVQQGGGYLATDNSNPGTTTTSLAVQTDANGVAQVYFLQPFDPDVLSKIKVTAGQAEVLFTAHSVSGSEPYTGQAVTIPEVRGDHQYRLQGQFTSRPLMVTVWNSTGTAPVSNAPVEFALVRGGGRLSTGNSASGTLATSLSLTTDQNGRAAVYYREPAVAGIVSEIRVTSGSVIKSLGSFSLSRSLATGSSHALALKADGTVWAWGANAFGQLGNDTTVSSLSPTVVPGLGSVLAVFAAADQSMALDQTGSLWTWGGGSSYGSAVSPTLLPAFSDVADVSAAADRSLVLKNNGSVWLLGHDATTGALMAPAPVAGLAEIQGVAAGGSHNLALMNDGTVWAWGSNDVGQLGTGTNNVVPQPTPARIPYGFADVISVAAGRAHSLALKSDGTVWAWGDNTSGQTAAESYISTVSYPRQVPGLAGIVSIYAFQDYNVAIDADGVVWAWGANTTGQLGDGTTTSRNTVARVTGFLGTVAIAGGDGHALALTGKGDVWGWGNNAYWQATPSLLPAKVDISLQAAPIEPPETGVPPPEDDAGPSADPTGAVRLNITLPPRYSTL